MTLRRTSKTKFYREGKEIESFEIDLESEVTVDVTEDTGLKFLFERRSQNACQPRLYPPWHFLYFFPLPHGQGSFRPTF